MAKKEILEFNLNESKIEVMAVETFLNDYLKLYSAHSNVRGIPFIGDGFKEAQRKAMWGMVKRGVDAKDLSVERVAAYCAAETDYHHGIGSMQGTIIGLAQNFAGSNNLNLLVPNGQFGSRLSHSASAPRYIETKLHENYRLLFKKEDDAILDQRGVGDLQLEPKFFIPLLPMSLVNGAEGMGTGHATHIFSYSPKAIIKKIFDVLAKKKLTPNELIPYWHGFTGEVSRDLETSQVIVIGTIVRENTTTLRVTELPVGVTSDAYEKVLRKLEDKEKDPPLKSFKNASDDCGFDFILSVPRATAYLEDHELIKLFKLEARDTENLTLWGPDGYIKKYSCPEDVIVEFVAWRLLRYEDRRKKMIEECEAQIIWLGELMRFIKFYLKNVQLFKNTGKAELIKMVIENEFTDPDRLLSQQIWSLTKDRIADLEKKLNDEQERLLKLQNDTPAKMYQRELKELDAKLKW